MTDSQKEKIGERLKLARLSKNATVVEFYSPLTAYPNNLSSVENGSRNLGSRLAHQIISFHNLNPDWLFKGEKPIYLDQQELPGEQNGVPYYNVELSSIKETDLSIMEEEPEFYVDFRPFNDCTAYLPVYGDSMYPRYASGEIIAVKEIENHDVILWGEAYLIITDSSSNNLRTVKLLFEHQDPTKIILRASNPNFRGDTVISKKSVSSLYIVKGKITRSQF
ncbi:LexA family transcriptional regulator [Pararcticibacter amylolyticus]|uniref:DNA-binding protein n=1 Tax=Pararcticibacter amylolyticus TaxID=2173175 RepID=A0A2U2PEC0_9SPHI|nr:LexA family transcriptional regulator [Pararcticibacter amylolyticus]PWG79747.1 DNA-binding protein [Pararcticibacter amylolyticus]